MFVVAKMNYFDNVLTQEIKEYGSLEHAYYTEAMYVDQVIDSEDPEMSVDEIKQRYFDTDMMINILEV